MLITDYLGEPLTMQKIVPGNTVTAIASEVATYKLRTLAYTHAGNYVMKAGDTIVGATSAATAVIVSRTITTGTDAGGNAEGVLTIKCQKGTFQSENLNVEGNSNVGTIAADSSLVTTDYPFKDAPAKVALVQALTNAALVSWGTILPGQNSLQGITIPANSSIYVYSSDHIQNIKVVDAASGSASTVKIYCFFRNPLKEP